MTMTQTSGPLGRTGRVDTYLTNLSVAFRAQATNYMSSAMFPTVPVSKQSGLFRTYDKGYFLRPEMEDKPYGDYPRQGAYKTGKDNFYCRHKALEKVVDDEDYNNSEDPLDPERGAQEYLTTQALISTDLDWAQQYFRPGVWTFGQSGVGGAPADDSEFLRFDQSGSNPVRVIRRANLLMAQMTGGYRGNVAAIGAEAFEVLIEHPDIVDRIKYTQIGQADMALIAQLLGVDRVVVGAGVYNAAPEGKADDMEFILNPKGILLCHAAKSPGLMTPSAGYTFSWNGFGGVAGSAIKRGRDDRGGFDWFQIHTAYDMKVVAPDLGWYFEDVIG